jgi:NAD(P)-dependent dehydrogenase (short-subunit alcohol dehydrogenase family)
MSNTALNGRTAIVTGASSGIGMACADLLVQDGAAVLIMGRNEEPLQKARVHILTQTPGARVEIYVGDACDDAAVATAVDRAYDLSGRLDMLVPTVGGPEYKQIRQLDPASLLRHLELNFLSAFRLIHHGLPRMTSGGTIVCISTAAVGQANMGLSAYAASKAALERFVRGAAFELGRDGIRINAVRPGVTLSAEAIARQNLQRMVELYSPETPLGRVGDPYEIARVVRFLAGPEASWITGETISADGGMQQGKAPDLMSVI